MLPLCKRHDGHLFLSLATGEGETAEEQAKSALQKVCTVLESCGANVQHVIRTVMYVVDIQRDWQAVGAVHGELFRSVKPVATMIQVARLEDPNCLVGIEVEAVAIPDTMTKIGSGGQWEDTVGYSRAVKCGHSVRIAGTTAPGDSCEEQVTNILQRFEDAATRLEVSLANVCDVVVYLKDIKDSLAVQRLMREAFSSSESFDCTTIQVSDLIDPSLLVEIQLNLHAATDESAAVVVHTLEENDEQEFGSVVEELNQLVKRLSARTKDDLNAVLRVQLFCTETGDNLAQVLTSHFDNLVPISIVYVSALPGNSRVQIRVHLKH